MVSGSLALLLFIGLDLHLGSSAAALIGESPIEWGDFPYVHMSDSFILFPPGCIFVQPEIVLLLLY